MDKIALPKHIFFTGVPGSRWSGIAQIIESLPGFNTTDRSSAREYTHNSYTGHVGAYFGTGMEFDPIIRDIDKPYSDPTAGCKVLKSHEWAHQLNWISRTNKNDWIMLVYRPNAVSQNWWHEAGGFDITYPNYDFYENSVQMYDEIKRQNKRINEFSMSKRLRWFPFTAEWCEKTFGSKPLAPIPVWDDVRVAIFKI